MECRNRRDTGEDGEELVASLCDLLAQQITCAREGNLPRVGQLGNLTEAVVNQIRLSGSSMAQPAGVRNGDLERLYGQLVLILRARQADVQQELKQLRRVRKAFRAYAGKK